MHQATLYRCFLLSLILALSHPLARGEAATASPLQLEDPTKADLTLSWEQVKSGAAAVSIFNSSDTNQTVSIEVTEFRQQGTDKVLNKVAATTSTWTGTGTLTLPKSDVTRFLLKMEPGHGAPPLPGLYAGLLVIRDTRDKPFIPFVKQIFIKVTGPQPALSKLTMVAWRLVPFTPLWCASVKVPLKPSDFLPDLKDKGTPIGFVQRDAGGTATVLWITTNTSAAPPVARIRVDELPHAGKYDGDISFNTEDRTDKTGVLTLSVLAKDIVIWPILVIAGGIWIAFIAKRYLGVLRISWGLRQQEAALGDAFRDAQKQFAAATQGTSYGAYSVAADVAKQRVDILGLLNAIEKPIWTTSLDNNQNYTKATSALQTLQTEIVSWGLLGPALASLAKTLSTVWSEVDGTQMIPPTSSPQEPEIIKQARELLVGHVISGADIDPLRKNAADAVALATTWGSVNQRAKDVTPTLAQMEARTDLNPAQRDMLANVKDELVAVWKHLWEAQTPSDLATLSATGSDLDDSVNLIWPTLII